MQVKPEMSVPTVLLNAAVVLDGGTASKIPRAGSKSPRSVAAVCINLAFLPPSIHPSFFSSPLLYRFQLSPRSHLTSNPIPIRIVGMGCPVLLHWVSEQSLWMARAGFIFPIFNYSVEMHGSISGLNSHSFTLTQHLIVQLDMLVMASTRCTSKP